MAITPQNISGEIVTWVPTNELQYMGKTLKKAVLYQRWKNLSTNETEWRQVAFINRDED